VTLFQGTVSIVFGESSRYSFISRILQRILGTPGGTFIHKGVPNLLADLENENGSENMDERPGRSTFAPSSLDSGCQIGVAEWLGEVGSERSVMFD
jgi:hypothetical protein